MSDRIRLATTIPVTALALLLAAPAVAAEPGEIGRVAAIEGVVYAQAPGQVLRRLSCDDPIYDGDLVVTDDDAGVGVLSSDFYTRLDQGTETEIRVASNGAPRLDLARGHVRLIDESPTRAEGRIDTPGLSAAQAGRDTEAFALPEKAWVVSMICGYADPVDVARRSDPSDRAAGRPGACHVEKPREPIYAADASEDRLPVRARNRCDAAPRFPVAERFEQLPVALTPPVAAGPPGAPVLQAPVDPCGGGFGVGCNAPVNLAGPGPAPPGPIVVVPAPPPPIPAPVP